MQQSAYSKEYLLNLCNDYNLPVSSSDNVETLENYVKAVMDESTVIEQEFDNFLENDPVYIGHVESAIIAYFKRLFRIRLSNQL